MHEGSFDAMGTESPPHCQHSVIGRCGYSNHSGLLSTKLSTLLVCRHSIPLLMRLATLRADHYRSLRRQEIHLSDLNLFIGANASGKSTILDALRFLSEAVRTRDLREPLFTRGGVLHLAWKGEEARRIVLTVRLTDVGKEFEWEIHLVRNGYLFHVEEKLNEIRRNSPPITLLEANRGEGWWWSGDEGRVKLKQAPTACALSAAAADASFGARGVAEFIGRWGFFDPSPFLLRDRKSVV